jgi:hypothetical protein
MKFRVKRVVVVAVIVSAIWAGSVAFAPPGRFEKVTDHCYYMPLKNGENASAIVTDEGILVADPPAEPELSPVVEALKRVSNKAVRWVVVTNPRAARSAGALFFAEQGAMLIGGAQLRTVSASIAGADSSSYPWLIFDRQMHLFPSNVEIRIMAIEPKGMTGGDVILHVPAEKVLLVGKFYEAARYPEIDNSAEGKAASWADGLKQIVDSVPVLKQAIPPKSAVPPKPAIPPKPAMQPGAAMPQAKTDTREPETTLEEGVAVISSLGEISNLQNMKDLFSACQKLRADLAKAVKSGRSCESFLNSSRADIYRVYGNFDSYASQLCVELTPSPDK